MQNMTFSMLSDLGLVQFGGTSKEKWSGNLNLQYNKDAYSEVEFIVGFIENQSIDDSFHPHCTLYGIILQYIFCQFCKFYDEFCT